MSPGDQAELNHVLQQAEKTLLASHSVLATLNDATILSTLSESSPAEQIRMMQLILQYRFNHQDALVKLMQIEQSLLQLLGVEKLSSSNVRHENLVHILGRDELHDLLSDLTALVGRLLRVIYRYQQQLAHTNPGQKKRKQDALAKKIALSMEKCTDQMKQFVSHLDEIQKHLKFFFKWEALWPIHDHIGAIKGPISRFYQLIQNGLKQSKSSYHVLSKTLSNTGPVYGLLKQAELTLDQMEENHAQKPFYSPPPKLTIPPDTLEKRANERRLGHFFRT